MYLNDKLKKLEGILNSYGQMLVALSGGVDSVFLLTFAYKLWGDDRVAAITANGPYFATDEVEYAKTLSDRLGISHKTIDVSYILPIIEDNPEDRCYHCKKEIFSALKERASMVGSVLADGTNLDDMSDFRPGYKAICELGVASPLKEAGLTKADIRQALKALADADDSLAAVLQLPPTTDGRDSSKINTDEENNSEAYTCYNKTNETMPLWEKPAFACLASRIPYGEKITTEKLTSIYKAEVFLRNAGFSQVRVRHHGDIAIIEVPGEDLGRFFDRDFMNSVSEEIKKYGFKFVTLDLGGYKMGGLNPKRQNL